MLTGFSAIVAIFVLWSLLGLFPSISLITYGLDYPNPYFLYKKIAKPNWFGVICLTVFVSLLCPAYTMDYWFYKLCTVGRN